MTARIVEIESIDDLWPFDMVDEGRFITRWHMPACVGEIETVQGDCFPIDGRCVVTPVYEAPEERHLTFPTKVVRGVCPPVPNCWGVAGCLVRESRSG